MALRRGKIALKRGKKGAKRKKRKATILRETALSGITSRVATAQALQAPLYECWERKGLFEPNAGIGSVVVTRKTLGNLCVDGRLSGGCFLPGDKRRPLYALK